MVQSTNTTTAESFLTPVEFLCFGVSFSWYSVSFKSTYWFIRCFKSFSGHMVVRSSYPPFCFLGEAENTRNDGQTKVCQLKWKPGNVTQKNSSVFMFMRSGELEVHGAWTLSHSAGLLLGFRTWCVRFIEWRKFLPRATWWAEQKARGHGEGPDSSSGSDLTDPGLISKRSLFTWKLSV